MSDLNPSDHRQWNATGNVRRNAIVPESRWASPSHCGHSARDLDLSEQAGGGRDLHESKEQRARREPHLEIDRAREEQRERLLAGRIVDASVCAEEQRDRCTCKQDDDEQRRAFDERSTGGDAVIAAHDKSRPQDGSGVARR